MDSRVEAALAQGGIIDLTTTGRQTGVPRRIEIYLHSFDGDLFLTGRPGHRRDWVANLAADPVVTLHLKRGLQADLPATAEIVADPTEKAALILRARVESWGADPQQARADLDFWVRTSPAVRLSVVG